MPSLSLEENVADIAHKISNWPSPRELYELTPLQKKLLYSFEQPIDLIAELIKDTNRTYLGRFISANADFLRFREVRDTLINGDHESLTLRALIAGLKNQPDYKDREFRNILADRPWLRTLVDFDTRYWKFWSESEDLSDDEREKIRFDALQKLVKRSDISHYVLAKILKREFNDFNALERTIADLGELQDDGTVTLRDGGQDWIDFVFNHYWTREGLFQTSHLFSAVIDGFRFGTWKSSVGQGNVDEVTTDKSQAVLGLLLKSDSRYVKLALKGYASYLGTQKRKKWEAAYQEWVDANVTLRKYHKDSIQSFLSPSFVFRFPYWLSGLPFIGGLFKYMAWAFEYDFVTGMHLVEIAKANMGDEDLLNDYILGGSFSDRLEPKDYLALLTMKNEADDALAFPHLSERLAQKHPSICADILSLGAEKLNNEMGFDAAMTFLRSLKSNPDGYLRGQAINLENSLAALQPQQQPPQTPATKTSGVLSGALASAGRSVSMGAAAIKKYGGSFFGSEGSASQETASTDEEAWEREESAFMPFLYGDDEGSYPEHASYVNFYESVTAGNKQYLPTPKEYSEFLELHRALPLFNHRPSRNVILNHIIQVNLKFPTTTDQYEAAMKELKSELFYFFVLYPELNDKSGRNYADFCLVCDEENELPENADDFISAIAEGNFPGIEDQAKLDRFVDTILRLTEDTEGLRFPTPALWKTTDFTDMPADYSSKLRELSVLTLSESVEQNPTARQLFT